MDYGMMTEQALQRVRQVQDANRHRLVHAVFRKMQIPEEHWADAIEARGIIVAGFKKPWDITIGTLNDAGAMKALFGENLNTTVVLEVKVEILTDIKKNYSELVPVEVEVGPAGQWQYFHQLGRKGNFVQPPGSEHGVLIDMILDQNKRTFPYHDEDWQEAAKHFGIKHFYDTLTANVADAQAKARISVECFAVSPIIPLNTNVYMQEAKGLALALHIKGVQFEDDEVGGFGLTPVVPIPLKGELLTGEVSEDGLTPATGPTNFRIRAKCFSSPYKIQQGMWLAPLLVQEATDQGKESGTAPTFTKLHSIARRFQRNASQRERAAESTGGKGGGKGGGNARGKRRAVDGASSAEEGEHSDGGVSRASGASSSVSKLAKRAANSFDLR